MALKTVNVSEKTKRLLDAIVEVTGYTQDGVVNLALGTICPGIWTNFKESMTDDELKVMVAKCHIRKLHYESDKRFAGKHGLSMEDMGYHQEEDKDF
jgi:hypothetical protein